MRVRLQAERRRMLPCSNAPRRRQMKTEFTPLLALDRHDSKTRFQSALSFLLRLRFVPARMLFHKAAAVV